MRLALVLILGSVAIGLIAWSVIVDSDAVAQERAKWEAEGWTFEEIVGSPDQEATYYMHVTSSTASEVTASAGSSRKPIRKTFQQESKRFLLVTMLAGDRVNSFCLVFSKAK